jgi:hypothetical protein
MLTKQPSGQVSYRPRRGCLACFRITDPMDHPSGFSGDPQPFLAVAQCCVYSLPLDKGRRRGGDLPRPSLDTRQTSRQGLEEHFHDIKSCLRTYSAVDLTHRFPRRFAASSPRHCTLHAAILIHGSNPLSRLRHAPVYP